MPIPQREVDKFLKNLDLDEPRTIPTSERSPMWWQMPEQFRDEVCRYVMAFGEFPTEGWRKRLELLEYGKDLAARMPDPSPPRHIAGAIDTALARIRKRVARSMLESLRGSAKVVGDVLKVNRKLDANEQETARMLKAEIGELLRGDCADWFK